MHVLTNKYVILPFLFLQSKQFFILMQNLEVARILVVCALNIIFSAAHAHQPQPILSKKSKLNTSATWPFLLQTSCYTQTNVQQ